MNFYYKLLSTIIIIGLILFLPIIPILVYVLTQNSIHLRRYHQSMFLSIKHIFALIRNKSIIFFLKRKLKSDTQKYKIGGYCNNCGNCCLDKVCIFLEKKNNKYLCAIYDSPFRKAFNCFNYPMNKNEINFYQCPTYFVINERKILSNNDVLWPNPVPQRTLRVTARYARSIPQSR